MSMVVERPKVTQKMRSSGNLSTVSKHTTKPHFPSLHVVRADLAMQQCVHGRICPLLGWRLGAEGGAHVMFRHPQFRCCIVKCCKIRRDNLHDVTKALEQDFSIAHQHFVQDNIISWWGSALVVPCQVTFESDGDFIRQLQEEWEANQFEGRRANTSSSLYSLSTEMVMEENALEDARGISNLSFEIKVKGVFLSRSPLIAEASSHIKYRLLRYQIMQRYKQIKSAGASDLVSWGHFRSLSSYHPSDLCSGDFTTVQQSIQHLLETPQNNLRVTLDGVHCYGWEIDADDQLHSALQTFFGQPCQGHSSIEEPSLLQQFTASILAKVLCAEEEPIRKLLQMQNLDVLDSEGATFVYLRLLDFYETEKSCQEDLLAYFDAPIQSSLLVLSDALWASVQEPSGTALSSFHISEAIDQYLQFLVRQDHNSASTIKVPYEQVSQLVKIRFAREDCQLLLKAWMLSTIACDTSLVVCLSSDPSSLIKNSEQNTSHSRDIEVMVETDGPFGRGIIHVQSDCFSWICRYKVLLLDVGLKALAKLREKSVKDSKICKIVSESILSALRN